MPSDHLHSRREFLALGAVAALAATTPAAASAKPPSRLPPRLSPQRRRTLGAVMTVTAPPLTRTARTRAVSRFEVTYRRSGALVRARMEEVLDVVEREAGGFSTLDDAGRRRFLAQNDGHDVGEVADFTLVLGFRAFVAAQQAGVVAEAQAAALVPQADDPSLTDLPDVTPAGDATGRYEARQASPTRRLQSAVREALDYAALPFEDDLLEGF